MPKNFKLMIALSAAVAAGSGVTAMYLGGEQNLFDAPSYHQIQLYPPSKDYGILKRMADLNGDGVADLATIENRFPEYGVELRVYTGDGLGQFQLICQVIEKGPTLVGHHDAVGRVPLFEITDVNGDGYLDIVAAVYDQEGGDDIGLGLAVFLNNSGNGFVWRWRH